MKRELADLMSTVGIPARWEDPTSYGDVAGSMIVVDLEGDCGAPFEVDAEPLNEGTRIGSTATADGRVLPFVKVDCSAVASLMGPFMAGQSAALKEFYFGRALGRILAHEVYHILTQSGDHAGSGVAKARFSGADLTKNRFEFDEAALTHIYASQAAEPANSASADGLADSPNEAAGGK